MRPSSAIKYGSSFILALLFVFLAPFLFHQVGGVRAIPQISYNCVNNPQSQSGHCYGVQSWGGANGADTRITLHAISGGNDFVNNEMWLQTSGATYWVEAGVKSDYSFFPADSSVFFWADNRPGGGYSEHYSVTLTSGDYSKPNTLTRITRSGTSNWNVSVNDGYTSLTGTSTNNNITIGNINIGEVSGNANASAPVNHFTNNRWLNGSNFQYQNNDGVGTKIISPVSAGWTTDPLHSSTGGDWHTCITGSGC